LSPSLWGPAGALLACAVACACTTLRVVQRPSSSRDAPRVLEELNQQVAGAQVDVKYRGRVAPRQLELPGLSSSVDGNTALLVSPSFTWRDLREVERLNFVPADGRSRGFGLGILPGLACGALWGAATGAFLSQHPEFGLGVPSGGGGAAAVGAIGFGILGLFVGGIAGATWGQREEIAIVGTGPTEDTEWPYAQPPFPLEPPVAPEIAPQPYPLRKPLGAEQ